ncbi:MAG: hypothetical protein KGJ60_12500 [Verrucomicrobiota bacterium]|nr:hypothetical protein [Verrucomicrobiota bacterium]
MRAALRILIGLNLALLGGLVFFLANQRTAEVATPAPGHAVAAPPTPFETAMNPFRWRQLESTKDYRVYVANLRAAGCPEPTIEDIVRGDVERAFAFERRQLSLNRAGAGPWSRLREAQLEAELLGKQPLVAGTAVPASSAAGQVRQQDGKEVAQSSAPASAESFGARNGGSARTQNVRQQPFQSDYIPSYPLAFENLNLDALSLSASRKASIRRVQQQFVNEIGGPNQNPDDPAYLARWQKAQSDADDMLRATLGVQDYMALQLQRYYANFQQLMEKSGDNPGMINPDSLSK